jgi:hypothetical protein
MCAVPLAADMGISFNALGSNMNEGSEPGGSPVPDRGGCCCSPASDANRRHRRAAFPQVSYGRKAARTSIAQGPRNPWRSPSSLVALSSIPLKSRVAGVCEVDGKTGLACDGRETCTPTLKLNDFRRAESLAAVLKEVGRDVSDDATGIVDRGGG